MSKNNPVGTIPVRTPMLNRILKAANEVYDGMSDDEIAKLGKEIKSVTETNCSADVYEIAKMLEHRVGRHFKGI